MEGVTSSPPDSQNESTGPEKDPVREDQRTTDQADNRKLNNTMVADGRGSIEKKKMITAPLSSAWQPSDNFAGPTLDSAAGQGLDKSNAVPLWSQDPLVNMLAVHFIVAQQQQQQGDRAKMEAIPGEPQQQANNMQSLLKRALDRMEELGGAKTSSTSGASESTASVSSWGRSQGHQNGKKEDTSSFFNNGTVTTASDSHSESNSNGNSEEDSNLKPPAAKRPRTEEESQQGSQADRSRSLSPQQQPSETSSCQGAVSRQALLAALQQHLDILSRRGQVSAVVPSFLNPSMAHPKGSHSPIQDQAQDQDQAQAEQQQEETPKQQQHSSTSSATSTSSAHAVRPRKRTGKNPTREQYFEDLASEYLSDWVPPIPSVVEMEGKGKKDGSVILPSSPSQEWEAPGIASDLSVSDCSTYSQDFGSSSGSSSYLYSTSDSSSQSSARKNKHSSNPENSSTTKNPVEGRIVLFDLDEDNKNKEEAPSSSASGCIKKDSKNCQASAPVTREVPGAESLQE